MPSPAAETDMPLAGIRVVEMSHMVMGPSCGMILALMGAEVIKVEPPAGDKTRALGGMGVSFFPLFNRGKRSVTLDLKTAAGQDALHRLLASADVFLENFRDESLARQGLAPDQLRARHPHLITAGHKGFLTGPYAHRPALDEVVQMLGGLAYMTGPTGRPLRVGSSANDIMGGMFGVIGILAALMQRRNTGRGQEIRVGLFENCLLLVAQHMVQFELSGQSAPPMPERIHAWPVYDIFETADGDNMFIGVVTQGHWDAFCDTFDLTDFVGHPELQDATQRIEARNWTIPIIARRMGQETMAALQDKLEKLNIPFAPINRPEDLFDDPHVLRPGGLTESRNVDGKTFRAPVLPMEVDGRPVDRQTDVPVLGADTDDILAGLGLATNQIALAKGN